MKKVQLTIKTISFFLLIAAVVFSSCRKKDSVVDALPANTDLTVNFTGSYTGVYTGANGSVSLTQKMKITKLSNNQIKVENNGGPIAVATATFNLSTSAASGSNIAGVASDGSSIAQSATSVSITYGDGAAYAGNK
jgi:hypothetical protein